MDQASTHLLGVLTAGGRLGARPGAPNPDAASRRATRPLPPGRALRAGRRRIGIERALAEVMAGLAFRGRVDRERPSGPARPRAPPTGRERGEAALSLVTALAERGAGAAGGPARALPPRPGA